MRLIRILLWTLAVGLAAGCGSKLVASPARIKSASPRPHRTSARLVGAPAPAQALVTDETQNLLLVVDLPSGRVARRVPLPPDPEDVAATGDGGVVIVVSSRAGKVTVLDRHTLRPIRTFGGFDEPHIVGVSPDDQYAYVTDDLRGTVTAIRLSDMRVTRTLLVGTGAHHLTFSPGERRVWVALGEAATTISVLSTVGKSPPPPSSPAIDLAAPRLIGHFSPGFPVHDLSFSPDGTQVWISSAAGPDVTVFNAQSRRVEFRVPVGAPPQHLAFAGRYAYITSGYGATIEKVDASTGRVVKKSTAPYGSFELSAADGYVVSASLLQGTLAVYTPALRLLRVVKLAPATREVVVSRPY